MTKKIISKVDAIVFLKNYDASSLVHAEVEILNISNESTQFIKAKDKIIIALIKIDESKSSDEYNRVLTENENIWQTFNVPPTRAVPVCQMAELDTESEECKKVKERLQGLSITSTGFEELKLAVKLCVDNEKNKLIKEHWCHFKIKLIKFTDRLFTQLEQNLELIYENIYGEYNLFFLCNDGY
jgi:hypothetical protein